MESNAAPGYAIFGRIFWMGAGPAILAIATVYIWFEGTGWHTGADYLFFGALATMVLGRWLEVRGGSPLTSDGEPATEKDFYRYLVLVLGGGAALWVLANAFGNHGGG